MGSGYLRWMMLTWCWVAVITQEEEEEKAEDLAEYTLIFKTANKRGAGTEGDVRLKLTGDHVAMSYPLRYRGTGPAFGMGREDRFNLTDISYMGPICSVQLWTKSRDSWFLDTLTIVDWKTDDKAVFNISKLIGSSEGDEYHRTEKADGKWSPWSDWSVCWGTCPTGSQSRTRECSRPPPACGGGVCQGVANETQECPLPECKKEETTTPAEASKVSIILPIVIAVCVILILIAVLVFRRKKKQRDVKAKEKSEHVATYDPMHHQPDGTYAKNNYAA